MAHIFHCLLYLCSNLYCTLRKKKRDYHDENDRDDSIAHDAAPVPFDALKLASSGFKIYVQPKFSFDSFFHQGVRLAMKQTIGKREMVQW